MAKPHAKPFTPVLGRPLGAIAALDLPALVLAQVRGGLDRDTQAAQTAIDRATSAVEQVAAAVAPHPNPVLDLLAQQPRPRRSGSGPTPAPALPPTSTLSR